MVLVAVALFVRARSRGEVGPHVPAPPPVAPAPTSPPVQIPLPPPVVTRMPAPPVLDQGPALVSLVLRWRPPAGMDQKTAIKAMAALPDQIVALGREVVMHPDKTGRMGKPITREQALRIRAMLAVGGIEVEMVEVVAPEPPKKEPTPPPPPMAEVIPHAFSTLSDVGRGEPPPSPVFRLDVGGQGITIPRPSAIPTPTAPPRALPRNPTYPRWVPPGEPVTVAGITITGGMIYTGSGFAPPRCLIDPSLSVATGGADRAGTSMPYWPGYATITPEARLAYLQWLADGRRDITIGIGHVFLFLYGLERRLIHDKVFTDATRIKAEVERLLGIYGGNGSFSLYAARLLDAVAVIETDGDGLGMEPPPLSPDTSRELPFHLHMRLGKLLDEGKPLTADWLLAWCLGSGAVSLRTPAKRAFPEFTALFRVRFQERFPTGMALRKPKSTIPALSYQAASNEFSAVLEGSYTQWPSVARLTAPLQEGVTLIQQCTEELDPYSRFLGRNPEGGGTLPALMLLPRELWTGDAVATLRQELAQGQDDAGHAVITLRDLLTHLGLIQRGAEKAGKPLLRQAGEMLERMGYGLEPDGRFDPRPPVSLDEPVVLFPLTDAAAPGPGFAAETLLLSLNAMIIHADARVTPEEEAALLDLAASRELPPGERARLLAHARWLLRLPPQTSRLKARLDALPPEMRPLLARHVVAMAGSDGHVDSREVKILEQLYRLLGIDPQRLYDDLHALGAGDAPVTVRAAQPTAPGIPIPAPTPAPAPGVALDLARIQRIREETREVSGILAAIFTEAAPVQEETLAAPPESTLTAAVDGLDLAHAALLHRLRQAESWLLADFHELCRALDLLPGGALETLNEWAYQRFDEPLIEEGDPLAVNLALLGQEAAA